MPSQRRLWDVGIDARARTSGSTDSLTRNERLSLSLRGTNVYQDISILGLAEESLRGRL